MVGLRTAQDQILDLAKSYGFEKLVVNQKQQIEAQLDCEEKKQLKEELVELARKFNNEMKRLDTKVDFRYNDTIEGLLVVVKEADGEKVVREIPSKEAIELMKKMHDLIGAIFDKHS